MKLAGQPLRFVNTNATPLTGEAVPIRIQNAAGDFVDVESLTNAYPATVPIGAVGDGVTDDRAAWDTAAQNGGIIQGGAGTYAIGTAFVLKASDLTFRGVPEKTILKNTRSGAPLIETTSSFAGLRNIIFEDITFDGGGSGNGITLSGANVNQVVFRRCKFVNCATYALLLAGINDVLVEDCIFTDRGTPKATAILVQKGINNLQVNNCQFLYMRQGIIFDTGVTTSQTEEVAQDARITNCKFDGGWYYLNTQFVNSGATVSYTSNSLTDTSAVFGALVADDTVVATPVIRTSSGAGVTYSRLTLTDTGATFVSSGAQRGQIIRLSGILGVVKNVQSETILDVEAWLATGTYAPTSTPTAGTAYTLYNIYIGKIASNTGTSITVDRWHDLSGTGVTPSAQTRYEVLVNRPVYHLHGEYSLRDAIVANNVFKRGWADQCSIFGYNVTIANNQFERGQDMGVTLHGQNNIVVNNRISWQGAGGLWLTCDDSIISSNVIEASPWENAIDTNSLGNIILFDANRNQVIGNICLAGAATLARHGIVLRANSAASCDSNLIAANETRNHSVAGLRLYTNGVSATITNLRHFGNTFHETTKISTGGTGATTFTNLMEFRDVNNILRAHIDSAGMVALGPAAAQSGGLRLTNNYAVASRNVANTADINIAIVDTGNAVKFSGGIIQATSSATNRLRVESGDVWVVDVPIRMTPLNAEPGTKVQGSLAYANGTGWNPGSGEGLYRYNGSAWVFVG